MAPQTGFEIDGEWTSLADESAFLARVAGETTAAHSIAGYTVEGNPIHRLDLGRHVDGTLFIGCLQHGNEPASREAALQLVRDLAYSADPAVLAYLATHRVVVVSNINADRLAASRTNANGVNLNRDWFRMSQPETRAVRAVIDDVRPDTVIDAHEYSSANGDNWRGYPAGTPGAHLEVQAASQFLFDSIRDDLDGEYTHGYYGFSNLMWAGLSTCAVSYAGATLLSETRLSDEPPVRVAVQRRVMGAIIAWHGANAAVARAAAKRARSAAAVSAAPTPIPTREYIGADGGLGNITSVEAVGYELAEPLPAETIAAHGITVDGTSVSLRQPARLIVAGLCDPESDQRVVDAERVFSQPLPSTRLVSMMVGTPAGARRVVDAYLMSGSGARLKVRLPGE